MAAIHGDNALFDTIRSGLHAQLTALMEAMAQAGDSPRPSAVYDSHDQIALDFPAISIGIMRTELEGERTGRAASAGASVRQFYTVRCDMCVHTDYAGPGSFRDEHKVARLLNSISNWFVTHDNLQIEGLCWYGLETMSFDEEFVESYTVGGKIELVLRLQFLHAQA